MTLVQAQTLRRTYWSYVNAKIVSVSQRWNCRVFGPHEWVPIERLIPSTGALIEEGVICDICRKEVG